MKSKLLSIIFVILLLIYPTFISITNAQIIQHAFDAPIDGGLFALLIGGIILGGREIYKDEKQKIKK